MSPAVTEWLGAFMSAILDTPPHAKVEIRRCCSLDGYIQLQALRLTYGGANWATASVLMADIEELVDVAGAARQRAAKMLAQLEVAK